MNIMFYCLCLFVIYEYVRLVLPIYYNVFSSHRLINKRGLYLKYLTNKIGSL